MEDVREELCELENRRKEKRRGDEASRIATHVNDELEGASMQNFHRMVKSWKYMERARRCGGHLVMPWSFRERCTEAREFSEGKKW